MSELPVCISIEDDSTGEALPDKEIGSTVKKVSFGVLKELQGV